VSEPDVNALRKLVLELSKHVCDLRASELAISQIISEILPLIDSRVADRLAHYADYMDTHREAILLELEKSNPWMAAELDADRDILDG